MKKSPIKQLALLAAVAFLLPLSVLAQDDKDKTTKEKDKEKKESEQIIITRKGTVDSKVVIEIKGDNITINGKPIAEFKDSDISVHRAKIKDPMSFYYDQSGSTAMNWDSKFDVFAEESNHAMLGVTTEKNEAGGVKINSVTKESAAEKLGLKEGDIITKIDETKIEDPDGLSKVIREHKPGDKVSLTYLRDKKEQKGSAELTKWKSVIKMNMGDMNSFNRTMPRTVAPRNPAQNWSWAGGSPKLGLSVQDTDEGKGVKVIEVDEDSNAAKAGVKENDVISEVDGKAVNSTDEMVKIIRESKDKNSIVLKLQRSGKNQTIEVKMPKKIKTADL